MALFLIVNPERHGVILASPACTIGRARVVLTFPLLPTKANHNRFLTERFIVDSWTKILSIHVASIQ